MGDDPLDGAAAKPLEDAAFAADEWPNIMADHDGDTLVIDPSAFSGGVTLVEVIADYAEGHDMLDLSDLLASLGALPPADAAEAATPASAAVSTSADVDLSGAAAGGSFEAAASLIGVHATIEILYDENQLNHTTTVT